MSGERKTSCTVVGRGCLGWNNADVVLITKERLPSTHRAENCFSIRGGWNSEQGMGSSFCWLGKGLQVGKEALRL